MSPSDLVNQLGEKELAILQAVSNGHDDTYKLGQETTLTNSAINYWIVEREPSLEDRGLVEVERVDGRVEREVDGQVKEFDSPKLYSLTDLGRGVVDEIERVETYQALSEGERVEAIRSAQKMARDNATRVAILQRELREVHDRIEILEEKVLSENR